jgi:hypothetical protein
VVTLADGSVIIAWSSEGQDGSMGGVFARHFSATGVALGAEFQVNQFTPNNQRTPAIAALPNGGYVVTWISELQRGVSSVDVYARIFNGPLGSPTNEFAINVSNNVCANPVVAASPQGGFMFAWSQNANIMVPTPNISSGNNTIGILIPGSSLASTTISSNGWDIYGCLFDGTGTPTTTPFRLNSHTYGDQYGPKISALGNNYMAVWTSHSQPDPQSGVIDSMEGVWGQVIASDGSLASANDLHVNTTTSGRQIQPRVTTDGTNRFLVVWSSLMTTGIFNFDLLAQTYLQSTP